MPDAQIQSYENHSKTPTSIFGPGLAYLGGLIATIVSLFTRDSSFGPYLSTIGVLLLGVGGTWTLIVARQYATKLQDRIIRAEMRARLYRILPSSQHKDIEGLTINQCVALRFASDAELPELTAKVVSDKLMERGPIKRLVKNWQADFERV